MDIQAYIASGILEEYALGVLGDSQRAEVEANADNYPEIRAELDEIIEALGQYAIAHAVEMPEGLTDKILEDIDKRQQAETPPKTSGKNENGLTSWILGGLLIGTIGIIGLLFNQNQTLRDQILAIEEDCNDVREELDITNRRLEFIRDKSNIPIALRGTNNANDAAATVYVDESKQIAYLDILDLPAPANGFQYQVWALKNNGADKIDLGLVPLSMEEGQLAQVEVVENTEAYAVSLEVEGGSDYPNPNQIYLIGTVPSGG